MLIYTQVEGFSGHCSRPVRQAERAEKQLIVNIVALEP